MNEHPRAARASALLARMGITDLEGGVRTAEGWRAGGGAPIDSHDPTEGATLATVRGADEADYEAGKSVV